MLTPPRLWLTYSLKHRSWLLCWLPFDEWSWMIYMHQNTQAFVQWPRCNSHWPCKASQTTQTTRVIADVKIEILSWCMLRFALYLNEDRSVEEPEPNTPSPSLSCDSVSLLVSTRAKGCDSFDLLPTLATSNRIMGCFAEPCCNHMAFQNARSLSRNLQ